MLQYMFDTLETGYDTTETGYDTTETEYDTPETGYDIPEMGYDTPETGYHTENGFRPQGYDPPCDKKVIDSLKLHSVIQKPNTKYGLNQSINLTFNQVMTHWKQVLSRLVI
jgi:hypothetical protein